MTPLLVHRQKSVDRAFERLYKRHVHDVYRYTLAVLHNEADAEDTTQATFLSAYRAFRRGERPHKPHNWLIKIAHNECRQRFRASARRPQEVALQETDGHAHGTLDEDVPTAEEIRHALAQLSFNQRAALVMRELEGRSYAEIASILESSVSAVETLLFRARRALREQLEGSLTCGQAELALARRLDGSITQSERGALRAHLRECKECSALERRQRAHRTALRSSLGVVTLPASLEGFAFFGFGGGAATVGGGAAVAGTGLAGKVAAVVAAGAVAAGAGHEAVQAVADKPKPEAGRSERSSAQPPAASPSFSSLRRVERAAPAAKNSARTTAQARHVGAPAGTPGKRAAHRRTLRPREVDSEPAPERAGAGATAGTAAPASATSATPAPAPQAPATQPAAATPPAPLTLPPVNLPPVPPLPELPQLPQLPLLPPPPPPAPPPIQLPQLPLLPPPPPLPELPLPPLLPIVK
jgi:RNA polymerase sigma factor (sigma-70 family)